MHVLSPTPLTPQVGSLGLWGGPELGWGGMKLPVHPVGAGLPKGVVALPSPLIPLGYGAKERLPQGFPFLGWGRGVAKVPDSGAQPGVDAATPKVQKEACLGRGSG